MQDVRCDGQSYVDLDSIQIEESETISCSFVQGKGTIVYVLLDHFLYLLFSCMRVRA